MRIPARSVFVKRSIPLSPARNSRLNDCGNAGELNERVLINVGVNNTRANGNGLAKSPRVAEQCDVNIQSIDRSIGNSPRNFDPHTNDMDDNYAVPLSPDVHTSKTGGFLASSDLTCISRTTCGTRFQLLTHRLRVSDHDHWTTMATRTDGLELSAKTFYPSAYATRRGFIGISKQTMPIYKPATTPNSLLRPQERKKAEDKTNNVKKIQIYRESQEATHVYQRQQTPQKKGKIFWESRDLKPRIYLRNTNPYRATFLEEIQIRHVPQNNTFQKR
ncbi:hypothetical protein TNCV_4600831 [Trichonephila clavipes]|nr:hypothetical protein TNCV_4600831 [Trichonephila clavipes]